MNQPGPGLFKIPSAEEKPSFGEFLEEPRYFASHQSINQSINSRNPAAWRRRKLFLVQTCPSKARSYAS